MRTLPFFILLLLANQAFSQVVTIDPKSSNPNIIQADSPSQAIQLPRVAGTASITSPQSGQIMYNSSTASPNFYNGTAWQNMGVNPNTNFPNSVAFGGVCCIQNDSTVTNWSWVVPSGITKIWVEMVSGGNGGNKFDNPVGNPSNYYGGDGGGYLSVVLNVLPDSTINMKTGNGGDGQTVTHHAYLGGSSIIYLGTNLIARIATDYALLYTPNDEGFLAFYEGGAGKFCTFRNEVDYSGTAPQKIVIYKGGDGGASYFSNGGEGEMIQTNPNDLTIDMNMTNRFGYGGKGLIPGGGGGAGAIKGGGGAGGVIIIHY
jgi:hypothetical protein